MKPTEELYYQYAGVITSVVNKYAYQCPDLADDLFLQAQLLFCQACVTYDPDHPSKASFETWLRNKLQDVSALVKKATRGPCLIKMEKPKKTETAVKRKRVWARKPVKPQCSEDNTATNIMLLQEIADNVKREPEDDPIELSDVTCGYILEDYSNKLSDGTADGHDYPRAMLPYIRALRGDALQVFKDFCEGRLDREPRTNLSIAKQKARGIFTPSYIYNKFYKQKGWTRSRVENAWRGLRGMLKNYVDGKMPTVINNPTLRKNKVPKGESNFDKVCRLFEERHSLSFNAYRVLCKKGILHRQNVSETEDLSKYLLHTFSY